MRIIQVENQAAGGRVAFELLKEKLARQKHYFAEPSGE